MGKPHKVCLLSGGDHPLAQGFYEEAALDGPIDNDIFRWDSGGCDCRCTTCKEVASGNVIYLYRYTSSGREVVKVTRHEFS